MKDSLKTKGIKNYIIYSSPSERAVQTAKIIAKEIKYKDIIILDEKINEIDNGMLSGAVEGDDIHKSYMCEFNKLPKDPIDLELSFHLFDKKIEKKFKTEPLIHITNRVKSFYDSLPTDKTIIVITHGGIIKTTNRVLFNIIPPITGDVSNGKNCTIMCILNKKKKYTLLTLPNTLHL